MKNILLASALVAGMLMGTASGRPLIHKRALITEVVLVTETAANVVVYVDEKGEPYSTTTEGKITSVPSAVFSPTSAVAQSTSEPVLAPQVPSSSPAPAPAPSELPSSTLAVPAAEPTSVVVLGNSVKTSAAPPPPAGEPAPPTTLPEPPAPTSEVPAPPPTNPSTPKPLSAVPDVPANTNDYGGHLGVGITYDPFAGSQEQSHCRSPEEIASQFDKMKDYKAVRIYGRGCNIIPLAIQSVLKNRQKLMAGVYMSNGMDNEDLGQVIDDYKQAIDTYAGGSWDVVQLFSVENEKVSDHSLTVSAIVDAIQRARDQLRGLGYNGPVGAVETVPATIDNPALCEASDVVMVNCHPFFDRNTHARDAGSFVKSQIELVNSACNNKRVVITETGWPHQGDANGAAVPSPENQRIAIESIRRNFDNDLFFHNAFDSNWKTNWAGTFNAEQFWGILH